MAYFLDEEYFSRLAAENHQKYSTAHPFPHIVLDNVFPENVLNTVLDEFPSSKQINWKAFNNPNERKLASRDENQFGENTRHLIYVLNSYPFLQFLEKLTGIENLIPDPKLEGGGLHQILPGGLLKVHADFNKHSKTKLDRRLNVLVYLNKNWQEEYGGNFELWDESMTKCEVKILPIFNRMAIFSTTSTSYHGHPDPLTCPDDRSRKSIAMYYYTNGRPAEEVVSGFENHSTLFRNRQGMHEVAEEQHDDRWKLVKKLVPPIVIDIKRKLFN